MIEIDTFRLAAGIDPSDEAVQTFIAADAAVQQRFAHLQPGLLRRTTAFGTDGRWAVITQWESPDDADRAAAVARDNPVVVAFEMLVDGGTRRVERYQPLP